MTQPFALETTIDSVTVFRSGARITRIADVLRGSEGFPTKVLIAGLPLSLIDGSVRARVIGVSPDSASPSTALPLATDVRVTLGVVRSSEDLQPARDEDLLAAASNVASQEAVVAQVQRELDRLSQLELHTRVADAKGTDGIAVVPASPLEGRLALLALRQQSWEKIHGELVAAKEALAIGERELLALRDRNNRATSAREPEEHELRKAAHVSLTESSEGTSGSAGTDDTADRARVVLEYRVRGARWAPSYVARIRDGGETVQLGSRAIVAQQTGEDWTGVNVTLVTASAETITALPTLTSLRIGRRQPPGKTGWRPPPVGTDELFHDYQRGYRDDRKSGFGGALTSRSAGIPQHGEFDDEKTAPNVLAPSFEDRSLEELEEEPWPEEVVQSYAPKVARAMAPPPAPSPPSPPRGARFSKSKKISADATRAGGGAPLGSAIMSLTASSVLASSDRAPEEIGLGDDLLDYSVLQMARSDAAQPGVLVIETPIMRYHEDLTRGAWSAPSELNATLGRAAAKADGAGRMGPPPGYVVPDAEEFDYAFETTGPVSVPSDGEYHSIALTSAAGPCSLHYQVCPRESSDVFRIARIENPLSAPLLAGPIDVYLDSAFLLSTQIRFTPPKGWLRFGLGVEQAVRVVRNTSFRDDSAGLLKGSRQLGHQLRIEAQNHLPQAIKLEVRERLPVTRQDEDDIKIELGQVSPMWEAFEPGTDEPSHPRLRGGFRWIVSLEAGDKTELKASYSIRIPSKFELVGGNRRDV